MTKTCSDSPRLPFLHVAVGVIQNAAGEILISQRAAHVHQGGLWEFPGGKVETGESVQQALCRELQEELSLQVMPQQCQPLIKIHHNYPDLSVLLDVWRVEQFAGIAHGREGQLIQWLKPELLDNYAFPAANRPIIRAAQLPEFYAILDDANPAELISQLEKILKQGIKLIQARLKCTATEKVAEFLHAAIPLCEQYQAQLLLNSAVKNAKNFAGGGLHLTSNDLMQLETRPAVNGWLAASCHNLPQLQHAEKVGVDFVVLAPVLTTPTHPDAPALGWEKFAELVSAVNLPVYGLGGLQQTDVATIKQSGGQGVAGIRMFLQDKRQ